MVPSNLQCEHEWAAMGERGDWAQVCLKCGANRSDAPSNEKLTGELWSFLRSTLSQGKDIHLDHVGKGYEEYSARLDEAARERADALLKLLADFPAAPESRDG